MFLYAHDPVAYLKKYLHAVLHQIKINDYTICNPKNRFSIQHNQQIVMHGAEDNELYSMGGRTRILHNNFTAR